MQSLSLFPSFPPLLPSFPPSFLPSFPPSFLPPSLRSSPPSLPPSCLPSRLLPSPAIILQTATQVISSPLSNIFDVFTFFSFTFDYQYLQQARFKSQIEQQRLQLQREHSAEMEQMLEKVSGGLTSHKYQTLQSVQPITRQCFPLTLIFKHNFVLSSLHC